MSASINYQSLVLSLPGRALLGGPFLGSVIDLNELRKFNLPKDLALAVSLVFTAAEGAPVTCVLRPEMFTHGRSFSWLQQKLRGATDHLHLSDGSSMKLIPGMTNHLFTYALDSLRGHRGFKRLMHDAPELLGQFATQVNSFHRLKGAGAVIEPRPKPLMSTTAAPGAPVWFYGFYVNPHSVEDSVEHMVSWGEFEAQKLQEFQDIHYVPLTPAALQNATFQRELAESIAAAYFNANRLLLIRIPQGAEPLMTRLAASLHGIRAVGRMFPRVRAANVFLVSDDLPEASLAAAAARLKLTLHQSVDFWRYTRSFYRSVLDVRVFLDKEWREPSEAARTLYHDAFGQPPRFVIADGAPVDEPWAVMV